MDLLKQKIESIIRDGTDPRVPIQLQPVPGFAEGAVALVLRVPRSWNGPHMVKHQNQTHFYSRNSVGKQPLEVREIRAAFLATEDVLQRVRRFRDERLARIIACETPILLASDQVKFVIHAIPLGSGERVIDLGYLEKDLNLLLPPEHDGSGHSRFNMDGFLRYGGKDAGESYRSYSQAFRDGAFEGVTAWPLQPSNEPTMPPTIYGLPIEALILDAAENYVSLLRARDASAPIVLVATLMGVKGVRVVFNQEHAYRRGSRYTIDRDVLVLPDVLVREGDLDLPALLKPAFDAFWQASGWQRSQGYSPDGKWRADDH
jgi:hypothetical protein